MCLRATEALSSSSASSIPSMISNVQPRVDQYGVPLNAHTGSLIKGQGEHADRFYYYGSHFFNCTYKDYCQCANIENQWIYHSIAVYSSKDLTNWIFEKEMFIGGFVQEPRVVFNPNTNDYVMILEDADTCERYPAVTRSKDPTGPFKNVRCLNLTFPIFSDWSVFSDPGTGKGYIIYNDDTLPGQNIEELTSDYSTVVPGQHPTRIGQDICTRPGGCAAPLMFTRENIYYALFGHSCRCCAAGSELFVYSAPHPLGPYTFQSDVNLNSTSGRVVHGQSTGVIPLNTTNGTSYLWFCDRWQSTSMWSTDFQYWGLLEFGVTGHINPIRWQNQFQIDLQ